MRVMELEDLERLLRIAGKKEGMQEQLEDHLGIPPAMRTMFFECIPHQAKEMMEFANELAVQAHTCSASSDPMADDRALAAIFHTLQKGAEIIKARISGQENFSESEIILLLQSDVLFMNLRRRKLHQPFEMPTTSPTLEKIFQMMDMSPEDKQELSKLAQL